MLRAGAAHQKAAVLHKLQAPQIDFFIAAQRALHRRAGERLQLVLLGRTAALLHEVIEDAYEQELQDAWVYDRVAEGNPVDGLFPPNAEWKAQYAAYRASRDGR